MITDRTQANVDRRNYLAKKGARNWTSAELAEWTGDPLLSDQLDHDEVVNLLPGGTFSETEATMITVGAAKYFENKDLTLSVGAVVASGGTPLIRVYWHDENGSDAVGASLSNSGNVTFNAGANSNDRANLAIQLSANVEYRDVMLEFGTVAHGYVSYTPIIQTPATKGAYNYTDLNRVESAVAKLANTFGIDLVTKTDWTIQDIPRLYDMDNRYLENIRVLRSVEETFSITPEVPESMYKLNYSKANDIEKILDGIETILQALYRCGDVFCGEV